MGTTQHLTPELPASPEPLIIPQEEHLISPQRIDRDALKVLSRLYDAGHSAYLVGGGVRDLYLNKKPKDFDISTSARPGQLRKLFRNSRTIGRRFRLVQVFFPGNQVIEVSTFPYLHLASCKLVSIINRVPLVFLWLQYWENYW